MNKGDLILISVDDHIAEPADMFDAHVPAEYKHLAPGVVIEPDGVQQRYYGDMRGRNTGLNAVAGSGTSVNTRSPWSWRSPSRRPRDVRIDVVAAAAPRTETT